jgi:hypothetical protein
LANLQSKTNRHKEAEAGYAEALKIYQEFAKINPSAYLTAVTMTLKNLMNHPRSKTAGYQISRKA